ncbi:SHOCT domain-containing protein [Micromonospora chersina]|uniref:SHOCT domain-containing protein n=1 Tax=Micromonospora chersina TaxID=47854 RepID=UPI0034050C20
MMYGYGSGWIWMTLMPVVWIALIAVIVWAVARLVHRPADQGRQVRETPQEILDRRFALGEIDAEEHGRARAHLAGRHPDQS